MQLTQTFGLVEASKEIHPVPNGTTRVVRLVGDLGRPPLEGLES